MRLNVANAARAALGAVLLLAAARLPAGNLLLNPSFELNNGQAIPTDWTYFKPANVGSGVHDYWIVNQTTANDNLEVVPHSGTYWWKQWFVYNGTNTVAGVYQTFSSSPGAIYQANGWLSTSTSDQFGPNCRTWLQVEFLDAGTNLLALYKSPAFSASVGLGTWFQYQVTNACDLTQPISLGDSYFTTYAVTGSVSQLVAPFGTASVLYRYCYLTVVSEGGSAYFDDAALNQISGPAAPVISNLFPQDTMIFVNPSNTISFNVSSPSGFIINNSGIHMTVNGSNVSSSLNISGSASSKNVSWSGLQSNTAYTASISVTDVSNLTVSATINFQTMWFGLPVPTYLWEAEDWDFTNGLHINFPDLCNAPGDTNCYFGKVGTPGTDELNSSGKSGPYRPDDLMGQGPAGDGLRPTLIAANRTDYRIDPFVINEWVNYTRDWPNSTNWVIARVSANIGDMGSLILQTVNPDLSTTDLGTFPVPSGQGYSAFQNVYLQDASHNNVVVLLNGKQTLRVLSGGAVLPNFFMLVPAQADLPVVSGLYPAGAHPFEYSSTLSFTVTTLGSSFPANGIRMTLDGFDVTSNLVITGTVSSNNVVYPNLLPNAIHSTVITCTNVLGHGLRLAYNFDTFTEDNYMVDCEDFDYGGGQFIPANLWFPGAYWDINGPWPAVTNVDFQHVPLANETYVYRAIGIPTDLLNGHDYVRSNYQYYGGRDWVLVYFAGTNTVPGYGGDWANYTRQYPPGSYYAYIRSSGDGPYAMHLDQVVSGLGTTNQVTKRLGRFGGFGRSPVYNVYDWVPLTDDGQAAPTVVKLTGTNTLRITTDGNCNPNYFMFVPTTGISLKATASGGSTLLSFPSQNGVAYRVFYRTNLTAGSWTLLTTVTGNGGTKTVTDPATGAARFYRVSAP
jgi:hypothetical protein